MTAQEINLNDYVWKNRLLVFLSNDASSPKIQKQLDILLADAEELMERKLILLQVEPHRYKLIRPNQEKSPNWIHSDSLFKQLDTNTVSFEIQLIGLDGGMKMRSNEIVVLNQLTDLIDRMPMRQIELRNKKEQNK